MAKRKKNKTDKPRRYRDARTGRFVTKKFAKKHPKKTLRAWKPGRGDTSSHPTRGLHRLSRMGVPEHGRRRATFLARMLWGIAIGFALAMAVTIAFR